jgi:hypothetical protein
MAMTERSRWELRERLKDRLGMETTNALLDELPPIGSELATKRDIAELRSSLLTAIIGSVIAMYTATLAAVVVLVATLH